ncbi:hypothetical protein A0H81_07371 [Grifola frondosa]|uniref:Uncharacterized protein n=1 Tax=Grifola frondosa TaxID=5627 RepID=A0A1C7MAI9_GRIFR|nr:hypothetical protein A0H81_07371 [Grifola frondosa]
MFSQRTLCLQRITMSELVAVSAVPEATKENPFFPPDNGRCVINELPTELLAHIFYISAKEQDVHTEGEEKGSDIEFEEERSDMEVEEEREEDGEEWEDVDEERGSALNFEVLISHVCRRWRAVALETPSLWTQLNFSRQLPYLRSRAYIQRSRKLPLTILMDFIDKGACLILDSDHKAGPPLAAAAITAAIELLRPHVARWRDFKLMVSDYEVMYIALQLLGNIGPAPQLEVFCLYHYGGALVGLELEYHTLDVRPTFVDFMNILRASPDLEHLTLRGSGPTGNPADWSAEEKEAGPVDSAVPFTSSAVKPLVLPKLAHLVLSYHEPDYFSVLLARLSFPALTELELDFRYADCTTFVQGTLPPLLSRITSAKLSGLSCNAAAAATALRAMVRVTSLNLNFDFLDHAWYTPLLEPPLACPRLALLTTNDISGREIKALVRARGEWARPSRRCSWIWTTTSVRARSGGLRGMSRRSTDLTGNYGVGGAVDGRDGEIVWGRG